MFTKFSMLTREQHKKVVSSLGGLGCRLDEPLGQESPSGDIKWFRFSIPMDKKDGTVSVEEILAPHSCCIEKDEDNALSMVMPDPLWTRLQLTSEKRYFSVPAILSDWSQLDSLERVALDPHQAAFIFDKKHKQLCFFDPNGSTNYFGTGTWSTVERLVGLYAKMVDHKVMTLKEWNPYHYILNQPGILYGGNCVMITAMFLQALHASTMEIADVMSLFGKLVSDKIVFAELLSKYVVEHGTKIMTS